MKRNLELLSADEARDIATSYMSDELMEVCEKVSYRIKGEASVGGTSMGCSVPAHLACDCAEWLRGGGYIVNVGDEEVDGTIRLDINW